MAQARDEAGNIWEVDAQGNPVRLVSAAGGAPQMPADPTFPYQGPKAAGEVANTVANAQGQQIDNRVSSATIPAQITSANADATAKTRTAQTAGLPEGFMWDASGANAVPIPGYTRQGLSPEIRSQAIQAYNDADAIDRVVADLKTQYEAGPGQTHGVRGLGDYFPTAQNSIFDDVGQRARGYVKRSLGFTGGEGNTMAESQATYDPYLPKASNRDSQILNKIEALEALGAQARKKAIATLGGTPDANGNITPLPNAMQQTFLAGADPMQAAGFGATVGGKPTPPEYQRRYEEFVARGGFTPESYAAFRSQLDREFFGNDAADQGSVYSDEGKRILDQLHRGGTLNLNIPPTERHLSGGEQFRNNLADSPVGAALIGAGDMGGFGAVSAIAPDQMQAANEAQPLWSTVGQIGGGIGMTSALGKGVGLLAGKVAPALLGGGSKSAFARGVGTDALYSAIYGNNTGQDPLESALWGAGGSAFGTGVGKAVGGAVGGVAASAPVQALRARGIPLTVGQSLGGFAKGIEDKATSIPFVGDMINARRLGGLQEFNRQAFNDAGAPIGVNVNQTGKGGLEELLGVAGDPTNNGLIGNAYDGATAGVRVPLDGQYAQDFAQVAGMGQKLPDDLRHRLGLALNNRVNPINDAGELTGETYQQAQRGLKSYKAENVKPGFEQDYRDSLSAAQVALKNQMLRGGGQDVVAGLGKADAAYRNVKTLEDAVGRAKGGSMSGEIHTFIPSQLQGAVAKAKNKFPGAHPLEGLADDGQAVLPSRIPDSGTAGRLAMQGGGLVGVGTAGGALYGGASADPGQGIPGAQGGAASGALYSALLTGALIAGGTKGGQKVLTKMLLDRPDALKKAGAAINRKKGLFGRATLPFTQPGY